MKLDDIAQKQVMLGLVSAVVVLSILVIAQSYILDALMKDSKHLIEDLIQNQINVIDKTWTCNDFQDYDKMLKELDVKIPNYVSSPIDQHIMKEGKDKGCL